jgi:hypothetical protein
MRHTINQNATYMLYITNLKRRECDLESFGAQITEFGVMVEKI